MNILQVLGFSVSFWQFIAFIAAQNSNFYSVAQKCKEKDMTLPQLRLKRQLFCNYDSSLHPNYFKANATVVTLWLRTKYLELDIDSATLTLHSWMTFIWSDPHLTWTPSNYDGIQIIHVKNWEIWTPDLRVYNSGDMSDDQLEFNKDCMLFENTVLCVSVMKFVTKCEADYTNYPYDKFQCHIVLGSWRHTGMEVDYQLENESGIDMDDCENNNAWDLKFINAVKDIKTHNCCPNDTFPTIDYNFLLTRYHSSAHIIIVLPVIFLIFLTLTVLCLNPKSVERIALASVNFICHLIYKVNIQWQLPYNGTDTPKIFVFYGGSFALATFAIVLTILLRKLEDMNMEMPNWISSTTMFVLNSRASRFLMLKDNGIKIADDDTVVTKGDLNVPKSETEMKKPSWRHFAIIIDWLFFICVIFTYVIALIIFVIH